MLGYQRGGIPVHVNQATGVAVVQKWQWSGGIANHLWFKNTGAGPIVLSFVEADATANIGVTVAAGGVWEGPTEIGAFYTKSAGASAFESVAFLRRG